MASVIPDNPNALLRPAAAAEALSASWLSNAAGHTRASGLDAIHHRPSTDRETSE
jgi:hypothetical protein